MPEEASVAEKDPGNSGPEEWTADLNDDEQEEVRRLLEGVGGGEDDGDGSTGN